MEVLQRQGVVVDQESPRAFPGVERVLTDLRWETEPGWIGLSFDRPTLCAVVEQVGGRCQMRPGPQVTVDGAYYGDGQLTFVATGQAVFVLASEMRHARLVWFRFDVATADFLAAEQLGTIQRRHPRFMFQDDRLSACANLLGTAPDGGEDELYGASLARALCAALIDAPDTSPTEGAGLPGPVAAKVFAHVQDHLDEAVTLEDLAEVASLRPSQFGKAFREATGASPQRWQMDARVRGAQRLMVDDPAGSLSEVATLSGFADQSHFSRAFFDITGASPTAWLHRRR